MAFPPKGWIFLFGIGVLLFGQTNAEDVASLREQIRDLESKVAALEARSSSSSEKTERLLSLHKKASLRMGGEVAIDTIYRRRDDATSDHDRVDSVVWGSHGTNLRFQWDATENAYLAMKISLDDLSDGSHEDDLLEEIKFVWSNIARSNWGLVFGKGEVPYGQDKTIGILQSYHHNDAVETREGPGWILAGTEKGPVDPGNPHANVGAIHHPGEVDRVYLLGIDYTWKERLKFEVAVFQNRDSPGNALRGMHEDRSDDEGQSLAMRIWWKTPLEGLTTQVSALRLHCDSRGDREVFPHGVSDCWALSVGFDWRLYERYEVFGEYQRGFDWAYTDNWRTDTFQFGGFYHLSSQIRLGGMAEWLEIDAPGLHDDYLRLIGNIRYAFPSGIFCLLESGYEWFDGGSRDGFLLAFRMGWSF